jgi:hypothetical protein
MTQEPERQRENRPGDQAAPSGLTRRHFLDHLKLLGIGAGAALLLRPAPAEANTEVAAVQPTREAAQGDVPGKKPPGTDVGDGDPDDPVLRVQYWRRRRRRWWRRRRRRWWRRRRWLY